MVEREAQATTTSAEQAREELDHEEQKPTISLAETEVHEEHLEANDADEEASVAEVMVVVQTSHTDVHVCIYDRDHEV